MNFTLREHSGSALVAVGVLVVALLDGGFDPITYAAFSIAIWAAVLAGLVSRILPLAPVAPIAMAAGLCLAGGAVLAVASIGWAGDQGRAFNDGVRASAYLGLFALAACTATPGGRARWITGLTAGLAAVAVLAVLSRLQPELFPDPDPLLNSIEAGISYPVGYWNGLGTLLALALVLLAFAGGRARDPRLGALAVALMPVAILGIRFTESRGGVLAAAAGLAFLIAARGFDRPRRRWAILIGCLGGAAVILATGEMDSLIAGAANASARSEGDWALLILVLACAVSGVVAWLVRGWELRPRIPPGARKALLAVVVLTAAVALVAADPPERFRQFKQPPSPANAAEVPPTGGEFAGSGRWQLWGQALEAFASAPAGGLGAGGYEEWWAQNASADLFVRNPHSLPFQQLAELGLLGIALLLGFLAAVVLAAVRHRRADPGGDGSVLVALLAVAAIGAAIDWSWMLPAVFGAPVIAAGLLSASAPSRGRDRAGYALGIGTASFAWIAMMAGALVVLGELKLDSSRSAAAEGRVDAAIERAEEARTVQPWSPEPHLQLALVEELRGDFDRALDHLRRAEARDSEDWRLAVIEARLHSKRGDPQAGRNAIRRARALNPRAPVSDLGSGG